MSKEYECLLDITLDLSSRKDICDFILCSQCIRKELIVDINLLPPELDIENRCIPMFMNTTRNYDNNKFFMSSDSNDIFKIKYIIGNKNKDKDMEKLILMLVPYITTGYILLDGEYGGVEEEFYYEVNIDTLKLALEKQAKDLEKLSEMKTEFFFSEALVPTQQHYSGTINVNESRKYPGIEGVKIRPMDNVHGIDFYSHVKVVNKFDYR